MSGEKGREQYKGMLLKKSGEHGKIRRRLKTYTILCNGKVGLSNNKKRLLFHNFFFNSDKMFNNNK